MVDDDDGVRAELAGDPHAAAVGLFPTYTHPALGPVRTVGAPMRINGADVGPQGPAPEIGEHTREVLGELGLSAREIDALAADGVVG